MAAPYLAIQTSMTVLALSDPVNATGYRVRDLAFPAPSKTSAAERAMRWGTKVSGNWDELAERVIELDVVGATEAVAENNLLVLQRAVDSHRAQLVWRSDTASQTIWTTIRTAQVTEGRVDKLRRAQGLIRVTLTLVTDAEWTGAGVAFSESPIVVSDGDRPARFRLKLTSSAANSLIGVGLKSDPSDDYAPTDTIGTPSATNLTAAYAALHTPTVIDTNAHKGQHVVVAKVATNAVAAASTRYRAVAAVTGSGVSDSASATKDSRAAQATTARWTALPGLVDIPAGGVPGIEMGSGWGAESVQTENTVDDGSKTLSSVPDVTTHWLRARQTFKGFTGLITAIEYTIDVVQSATTVDPAYPAVRIDNGRSSQTIYGIPATAGTHKVELPTPLDVRTSDTPYFELFFMSLSSFTVGLAVSNGDYADGVLTTPSGSGASTGDDLTFKVYGQSPLGFDSTVTVQANCSESSKTATLSAVTLLPADDFAAVYEHAFGANEGVLIEATDPLSPPAAYLTTSTDGTAGPTVAPSAYAGTPRLRPGVNQIVTAADGTVSLSGVWMPCYSNAAAGSL